LPLAAGPMDAEPANCGVHNLIHIVRYHKLKKLISKGLYGFHLANDLYLQGHESHGRVLGPRPCRRRNEAAEERSDRPDENHAKPSQCVDFDGDHAGVGLQRDIIHAKHKLLVPVRVCVPFLIDPRRQFPIRMDPRDRIRPHGFRHWGQILGRYEVKFEEPAGRDRRSHGCHRGKPPVVAMARGEGLRIG